MLNFAVYIDKHTQPDTGSGEWCLDALMKQHYGTLTAFDIIRDVGGLFQTGDAHIAVYDFEKAEMYCELQYKCQLVSEFSIENAERMENCPWKTMILY